MKKFKHADLVKAYMENMDLVVLIKGFNGWQVSNKMKGDASIIFSAIDDYFLCLDQHLDVCLAWLAGAQVESYSECDVVNVKTGAVRRWGDCTPSQALFLSEFVRLRVKQKEIVRVTLEIDGKEKSVEVGVGGELIGDRGWHDLDDDEKVDVALWLAKVYGDWHKHQ